MKSQGPERGDLGFVFMMDVVQASVDTRLEVGEGGVVTVVERLFFDEFPQPFDEVQVGEYLGGNSSWMRSFFARPLTNLQRW